MDDAEFNSVFDEAINRDAFDEKAKSLLNSQAESSAALFSESTTTGQDSSAMPESKPLEDPQIGDPESPASFQTTIARASSRASQKGKKKKQVQYIGESESSLTPDKLEVGSGMFGAKIAEPISAVSSKSVNPFFAPSASDQAKIELLQKELEQVKETAEMALSDTHAHGKEVSRLAEIVQKQQVTIVSLQSSMSSLLARLDEFDSLSLRVVERASEVIDKISPDQQSLLRDLEREKKAAEKSREVTKETQAKVLPQPKQAKKKLFGFNKLA